MARLTSNDYLKILDYYKIDSRKMKKRRRQAVAKDILASKLCRCIKKIAMTNESRAISICKNSIFTKKRLNVGRFKCKKGAMLIPSRNGNTLLKLGSNARTLKRK